MSDETEVTPVVVPTVETPEGVTVPATPEVTGIKPLTLNPDFGRLDLNEAFKKVEDKINEIIRKK